MTLKELIEKLQEIPVNMHNQEVNANITFANKVIINERAEYGNSLTFELNQQFKDSNFYAKICASTEGNSLTSEFVFDPNKIISLGLDGEPLMSPPIPADIIHLMEQIARVYQATELMCQVMEKTVTPDMKENSNEDKNILEGRRLVSRS
jgi:hypothetical protein